MKLQVTWIQARSGKDKLSGIAQLTTEYIERLRRYVPTETREASSESGLFKEKAGRTRPYVVLLDSRGKQLSSEELARLIGDHQQRGTQQLLFAVGGADGFTPEARSAADIVFSLGRITLPHELARVVLLEQLYRAFTILAGHPYHSGH
jgi:23S rRNA (pseudouridine1915-N3)-methyltransferase